LGCANHYKHKIELNNFNPIYVKQFRNAEANREGLFDQVKSWLTLGISWSVVFSVMDCQNAFLQNDFIVLFKQRHFPKWTHFLFQPILTISLLPFY
jgi:hypothetical protein